MWLERFAVSQGSQSPDRFPKRDASISTPKAGLLDSNAHRRRPTPFERSFTHPEAALSLSTESLPVSARVLKGTNLKAELQGPLAADVPEPCDVLETLIGDVLPDDHESPDVHALAVDNLTLLSPIPTVPIDELASMALDVSPKSTDAAAPWTVITSEQDKFDTLHKSIVACDEILMSVESYLNSFRTELAAVSSEIEHLQERSTILNRQLETRQRVQNSLAPEITTLITPPAAVRKLTEGIIDEAWARTLRDLQQRLTGLVKKCEETSGDPASEGMLPFLQRLSDRVVERIRDHIVAQIKALRSPNIDAQIIQQVGFLQCRNIFKFLGQNQPELAEDITQAYVNTMSWYYSSHFMRYRSSLDKLNLYTTDQAETFAMEKNTKRSTAYDMYTLGRRIDVLRSSSNRAMPASAVEDDKGMHYIEVPFRAFNLALIDNATTEYLVMNAFFEQQSFKKTNQHFTSTFNTTFELGRSFTKHLIDQNMDALGVLLCIRLTQRFAFELQRRKIPAMDGYINGTNMILWPRFQSIIDGHCSSIRKATLALTGRPASTALTLSSPSLPSGGQTTAPHPLTQRFANFVYGILLLSEQAGDDEPVSASLGRLRIEFESFLNKMSKGIAETRKRERFLHNNFSLICTVWADLNGKLAEEVRSRFSELRDALEGAR